VSCALAANAAVADYVAALKIVHVSPTCTRVYHEPEYWRSRYGLLAAHLPTCQVTDTFLSVLLLILTNTCIHVFMCLHGQEYWRSRYEALAALRHTEAEAQLAALTECTGERAAAQVRAPILLCAALRAVPTGVGNNLYAIANVHKAAAQVRRCAPLWRCAVVKRYRRGHASQPSAACCASAGVLHMHPRKGTKRRRARVRLVHAASHSHPQSLCHLRPHHRLRARRRPQDALIEHLEAQVARLQHGGAPSDGSGGGDDGASSDNGGNSGAAAASAGARAASPHGAAVGAVASPLPAESEKVRGSVRCCCQELTGRSMGVRSAAVLRHTLL
jgi:uncharacterized membrane protein YgcG